MRSELLSYDYWVDYCNEIFGVDLQINRSIAEFAFPRTEGSNIVITNGAEDPWQWATEKQPNNAVNQLGLISECTDCGHCVELYTPKGDDSEALV